MLVRNTDWDAYTLRELLTLVSGLFDELHAAPAEGTDDAPDRKAANLRRALGEMHRRAAEVSPALRLTCSCGAAFASADGLEEHFYDVFVPADDLGLDGQQHVEISAEWTAGCSTESALQQREQCGQGLTVQFVGVGEADGTDSELAADTVCG